MIKTSAELRLLKRSAKITNSCIPLIAKCLTLDITEKELSRRIREKIYSQGATLSFRTLVASGKRSAMIHAKPSVTNQKIQGIGYIDFGASYKGYKTDATVPFIKGPIELRERKIVKAVLDAYNIAVRSVKVGMPCWKLHQKVDKFLRTRGFRIEHALGHGLGKNIHENPIIGMSRKKLKGKRLQRWLKIQKLAFQPNMVFTIEPGVYVKGVGGFRFENDFWINGKKIQRLTNSKMIKV